ncbi:MAG: heme-copper oxidase subunit III [Actinomycetota bacterium]|nr:heme-copper oxidase subunit III [Actinomycetota bacterium]
MTLFVSSETMFFGALFASYFFLRGTTSPWPPEGTLETPLLLPVILTLCLLASSGTMHAGAAAVRDGRRAIAARHLAATFGLGLAFLAGQLYEYSGLAREGFAPDSDAYASLFFTITGFHGLHVTAGLLMLATVYLRVGRYAAGRPGPVEAAGYYWHFVDVVWLLVFTSLYVVR